MRIAMESAAAVVAGILIIGSSATSVLAADIYETTTNITFWTTDLKVNLTGFTPGVFSTNGVLAKTHPVPVKVTSQDLIHALYGLPAFTIGRRETNYTYETIEFQAGPNITNTHHVTFVYPIEEFQMYPSYSAQAKLMVLQPLADAQVAGPFVVIRDGAAEYSVNDYFTVETKAVANEPEDSVFSGQVDIVHNLVSGTQNSIKRFRFDIGAFGGPPPGFFYDVDGWTTERLQAITRGGNVIDGNVMKSFSASVAGTGRRPQGGFTVLRGSVSTENGRLETR